MKSALSISYLVDVPQYTDTAAAWLFADRSHYYPQETSSDAGQKVQGFLNKGKIPFALVAHDGNEAAGMVCLVKNNAPPAFAQLSPWLAGLVVAPKYQGLGVEAALLAQVITEARTVGCSEIFVWTEDDKDWYQQQGWKLVGTTIFGRRYVVAMRLDLAK